MKHFIKRTLAYFIDCMICYAAVMLFIQLTILSLMRDTIGITNEWLNNSWNLEIYVLLTISLPVWCYFAYFDSNQSKGTFGKRIFKLHVTNLFSEKLHITKSFLRTWLKLLPWEISHLGLIFPTPMYFETNPEIRMLTIIGIALLVIYATSIILDKNNRSVYDKLLSTKVQSR